MRISDMLLLAVSTLWQQKMRTFLTTLGVVFGSFVLAASLSINQGVQKTIDYFVKQNDALRKVDVHPDWNSANLKPADDAAADIVGQMSDATRQRLRQALQQRLARLRNNSPAVSLNEEMLKRLGQLEHVEAVVPAIYQFGFADLDGNSQPTDVSVIRANDSTSQRRLLAGRLFQSPAEHAVVVTELLLYRLGIADEQKLSSALGKKLRLEFRPQFRPAGFGLYLSHADGSDATHAETTAVDKIRQQLPASLQKFGLTDEELAAVRKTLNAPAPEDPAPVTDEFTIVGVVRMMTDEEQQTWDPLRAEGDVLLPVGPAADLYFRQYSAGQRAANLSRAIVVVDNDENIKPVVQQIRDLGLGVNSALDYVEQQRLMYHLIFGGMTCVATVALLVAGLGIANTMLISVLERTREIGVLKAVGARNGQLQIIFVIEGALIGLAGSVLGLLLAWAGSFPGDAWVRTKATRDLKFQVADTLFVFPPWLIVTVLAFAVAVTVVAAIYPARRAARIDPVAALRHE